MLHLISTSLGHSNKSVNMHLWSDQFGVKGTQASQLSAEISIWSRLGSQGQKVIFTKNA